MTSPLGRIGDLRVGDIQTFLAVRRWESITGAARALHVTPSQVSKAVARLEEQLGVSLLARGARGVSVSATGQRLLVHLEEIVKRATSLRAADAAPELSVAAPAFLSSLLLPRIAEARRDMRVRGIELPPPLVRAYAAENFFDMALTLGLPRFPDTWIATSIGEVKKAVLAPVAMAKALGPEPVSAEKLVSMPFVVPVYNYNGQFLVADDGCPLGAERKLGHEVQTVALALDLAVRTGQLVFGPLVAARAHIARGDIAVVEVEGWDVKEPVYATCNGERMMARDQKEIVTVLRAELARAAG